MKGRTSLLVVISLTTLASNVARSQSKRDSVSQVLAVEKQWNEVYKRGDIAKMNALLTDHYIITVEDGSTFSKPGYIAHTGNSTVRVEVSHMSDLKVRMHGNTAVVTGAYHEKGMDNGRLRVPRPFNRCLDEL